MTDDFDGIGWREYMRGIENGNIDPTGERLREVCRLAREAMSTPAAAPPSDRTEIAWLLLSRWENIARNGGEKWLANHPLVHETTDLLNNEAVASRSFDSTTDDVAPRSREAAFNAVSEILCGKSICTDVGDWLCPQDIDRANEMIAEIVVKVTALSRPEGA